MSGIHWKPARIGFGRLVVAVVTMVAAHTMALAEDSVRTRDGGTLRGALVSVSPDGVDIEESGGEIKKVSIVELDELVLDGEPEALRGARGLLRRRDAAGAAEEITKIEEAEIRAFDPRIREEYDFIRIASNALAATNETAASWEKQLVDFLQKNARSHHFYYGSEILGDLRARQGKFVEASEAYRNLDRGPPALRVRSAAARAGLLMRQGKYADAIKEFSAAEKIEANESDAASARQKLEAVLGRARCLALSGKAAEGTSVTESVIKDAQPEDKDLLALAYTTLGTCQRAAGGKDQDAIISFLTVDLVFNTVPIAHAEALSNLVELWNATNQPERARAASQTLVTTYPNSSWAAKLSGAEKAS